MEKEEFSAFEWNEAKRLANIEKHGLDFEDAVIALGGPRIEYASFRGDEERIVAVCFMDARLIAVVYTMRGSSCRIICARVARTNERRAYYARYPG